MEMEWEIGTVNDGRDDRFPKEFWPSVGDRVWMMEGISLIAVIQILVQD